MSEYSIRNYSLIIGKVLKFIGFATFSLRNEKLCVTRLDFACITFNLIIGLIMFHMSLRFGIDRLANSSVLLAIGALLTMVSGSLVSIISIVSVFCHRHRIWKIINILDDTMKKFRKIKINQNFSIYIMIYGVFMVVSVLLIVLGLTVMYVWLGYNGKIAILSVYGYLSTSFSACMGWSSMFYLAIYLRLKLLNNAIR